MRKARSLSAAILVTSGTAVLAVSPAIAAQQRAFDIPAAMASASLPEYGRQAGVQIVAPGDHVAELGTVAVQGSMDSREALRRLLAGTGLEVVGDDGHTVTLGMRRAVRPEGGTPRVSHDNGPPATVAREDAPAVPAPPRAMQAMIVTGTRVDNRTEGSSLAPIDVVSAKTLSSMGTDNIGIALSRLIPSLSFQVSPVAMDAADGQRPIKLRGLSPDQVLVLVNGKRWHTAAMLASGSTPVDLDTIPMAAVDHVEVLRDGASAQYGSDAIAGVINIILRHGADDGSAQLHVGRYQRGGGQQWRSSINVGIPLDKGWIHLTADRGHQNDTDHGAPDTRYPELGKRQGKGNPSFGDGSLFLNSEYDFSKDVQFYAFGSYHRRDSASWELYRAPYAYADDAPIRTVYPEGFQPRMYMQSTDASLVAGFKGVFGDGWRWDVSANYGGDDIHIQTLHTANLALLQDTGSTPSDFHDGRVASSQQVVDADLAKEFSVGWLPNPVTLAFGAEYLRNTYRIVAGDPVSYYVGSSGQAGGAQSFNGFSPVSAGKWSRSDVAEYASLDTNLTDRLAGSLAVRHEHYTDFGNTTSGALSGRFDFTDRVALRGSVSTGFRAPSLAQQYYSQVGSTYLTASSAGAGIVPGIYQTGLLRVDSDVARLLGAQALKPEKSRNYTLGLVLNPLDPLTVTFDVYQIYIKDRVVQSSNISGLNAPNVVAYFAAHGVTDLNYSAANFFTNAVDTKTRGADLVVNYRSAGTYGTLNSTLSYNYNRNQVTHVAPNPPQLAALGLNLQRITYSNIKGGLADSIPRSKLTLGETYATGRWTLDGNLTHYGRYTSYSNAGYEYNQVFRPQWILDLSANYEVNDWTFTVGSDNVTNRYPDKVIGANNDYGKAPYSILSPYGFNGRYFYTRITYRW